MQSSTKREKTIDEKRSLAEKLIKENPNYIPLEINRSKHCSFEVFERKNFLVPCSFPFYLVMEDIRKRIGTLDKNQALFCFINQSSIVKSDTTVGELYSKFKGADGFLHIEFSDINAYG